MSTAGAEGRVVTSRIVLFGPAGAGTTTTLETIARRLRADQRGALVRQGSSAAGSGAYETLPLELREVNGLNPRFHLATVPGGPAHGAARRQLLKGADGILFVADSAPDRTAEAVASMQELAEHLAAWGRPLDTLPIVILLNKRDRSDAAPAEQLLRPLLQRLRGRRPPVFEAVATNGRGILNALSAIAKLVLHGVRRGTDAPLLTTSPSRHALSPAEPGFASGAPPYPRDSPRPGLRPLLTTSPGHSSLGSTEPSLAPGGPLRQASPSRPGLRPPPDNLPGASSAQALTGAPTEPAAPWGGPAGLRSSGSALPAGSVSLGVAASATAGAAVTVGPPRATSEGLVVPLLVRDARGAETRLTLTLRLESSRGDASGDGSRGARS